MGYVLEMILESLLSEDSGDSSDDSPIKSEVSFGDGDVYGHLDWDSSNSEE